MRMVNITFQASKNPTLSWDETPIVYVLKNVPANKDITDLCECISVLFGYKTVRTARLFLNDELTPESACKHNGGYYTAFNREG